jgi:3-oxoacyl-(acyl-carrier-protein) synthase III
MTGAKIISVAAELAPNRVSVDAIAAQVQDASPALLPVGAIKRLTGVNWVHHRDEGQQASDLAAGAARTALDRAGLRPTDLDLLIFASASQDLIEPATSHIVSHLIGATGVPVMDVKNACNSFLNGVQVADAFIRAGIYRTVAVVSGETPSSAIRWVNTSKQQFARSFPAFSMSDGGAAMILTASTTPGVHAISLTADSASWEVGTLGTGGSRAPRDINATYFDMDGAKLFRAFLSLGAGIVNDTLGETGRTWDDFKFIGMHQISATYLGKVCEILGVPHHQVLSTVADHGNVASLSLPLQLQSAMRHGLSSGDEFAFIGFGGGISTGLGVFSL